MFSPSSKFYTVSTVFFHKNGGAKIEVTKFMSHFCMFVITKATLKLDNGKTRNAEGIDNFFLQLFDYISSGTSLSFYRSPL